MKKIISIILVVINLLSFSAFADTAQLDETQKSDLYNLGIMIGDENGDLRLGDLITRAEAVKMICTAGNFNVQTPQDSVVFPDVSSEHWAYKYIYAAKENKIIIGDENGNFNPDANVTNEEIIKMIVCLLGYDVFANEMGGYPAGYRYAATDINLTDGMRFRINTPAIRGDVAVMMARALDIPLMTEKDYIGSKAYVIIDTTLRDMLENIPK